MAFNVVVESVEKQIQGAGVRVVATFHLADGATTTASVTIQSEKFHKDDADLNNLLKVSLREAFKAKKAEALARRTEMASLKTQAVTDLVSDGVAAVEG